MKTIKTLFTAALLLVGMTVSAQTYTTFGGTEFQFEKHAFLNVEGGAQYTLGESSFSKLLSPNVQLGLGYQFSPVIAARLQANAWQSKGGWPAGLPTKIEGFDYKFKYVAPGIDVMFNLSNLLCGYNPFRVFNVTAFLGAGANIAWDNQEVNDFAATLTPQTTHIVEYLWDGTKIRPFGRAGLELGFRLSDAVSLLVEGNANLLSDKYNSKKAGNPDWYFNGLVGLRINLGKTYTAIVPEPAPVPEPEPQPVVEPEPQPVPQPVVEQRIEPLKREIFFTINKWEIRESEQQKVKDIADYLKKYPKAKVDVTGYADAGTGNDRINDRLAAKRADIVVKALREQYGISEDRISYSSKGSRVQPFSDNDKNRVTICIAE